MPGESHLLAGGRTGVSLVEALAALTLSSLIGALVVGVCIAQLRLARVTAERARSNEAGRTVVSVLAGEVRRGTIDDVRAWGADSLAIRSFRGAGLPCGATAAGTLVRYTGDRLPDPAKDSVLVVAPPTAFSLVLLESRSVPGLCVSLPGEVILEWRLGGEVTQPAVLLAFESGAYFLTSRALRYRLGAAGRQPLTEESLRHPHSRFLDVSNRAVRFQIDAGGHPIAYSAVFSSAGTPPR